MSTAVIQNALVAGELSPSLFGRSDTERYRQGSATLRNMFVSYLGGAYSRAGTSFVGYSKQTGRAYPPRLVPFQFNVNQGLALEFGNQYMRVISNGAFVTEAQIPISAISNASPGVITLPVGSASHANANIAAVSASYAPGEIVTLAGGTFTTAAKLQVATTQIKTATLANPGATTIAFAYLGYAPGDTLSLTGAGSVATTDPQISVLTSKVVNAAVYAPSAGSGGTPGAAVVTGTTGTGTKFTANVTIDGSGKMTTVNSFTGGSYTANPTYSGYPYYAYLEPVTGGGLVGAYLVIGMGIDTFTLLNPGEFTTNPSGAMSQLLTSGGGSGATFTVLMAPLALSVQTAGAYSATPADPVAQASTTGAGVGATFNVTWAASASYATGDWLYLSGIAGMPGLNGRTVVVTPLSGTTLQLYDVFGAAIDTTAMGAYAGGGHASRIYTMPVPYTEQDLPYLKFIQSADVMSLTCVNTITGIEYPAYDLGRVADANWTLTQIVMNPTVSAPTSTSGTASAQPGGATASAYYQYVVTAVNAVDGSESVASPIASIPNAVDIAATAGSVTVKWDPVAGVNQYNVYKATPVYAPVGTATVAPPIGALFGYAGSAFGTQFTDSNILADFAQVPPLHRDPFARGRILNCTANAVGTGYTTATATINTSTGSGAVVRPIIVSTQVVAYIVDNEGRNYAATDTITIGGDGAGATATLSIAPQKGTYPSVVAYFQERRVYANTLNNPDSYFMSQPGTFLNFDSRIPTIASDAITGSPWSVQVNGIQWLIAMPGGLVALTGLSAWQLAGAGSSSINPQPMSPSNQQAQPQAYNGCSPTVPPVKIDYDIIYVQAKGSIYRDLAYQFFTNIYTGSDLTLNSSHLFKKHTIREHAWAEEPYRTLWSVRDDGVLLTMTYVKPEKIVGWGRSDTQGLYKSVCSVTEPPVDTLYLGVQRRLNGHNSYMIERMDNRLWNTTEEVWCVDAGLSLALPTPAATLTASSATGLGACSGITGLVGGSNYSAFTTASVVDANGEGPGSGATVALTIVSGVITAITLPVPGSGYIAPALVITDPIGTGAGASATITLSNAATFTTDVATFSLGSVGSVIRAGFGIATITGYTSATQVTANINSPIVSTLTDGGPLLPFAPGQWSLTAPASTISGLWHLAGATVTGLADGNVISPRNVSASGTLTLDAPATAIVIGLGYQCQWQSIYLETGNPTLQGQRKKVGAASVLIEQSRGLKMGGNQVDGSTLSPPQTAVAWRDLQTVPDKAIAPYNGFCTPLYTGYVRVPVPGGYDIPGQVCLQQDNPLPMQILDIVPEVLGGDESEQQAPAKERKQGAQR
jgi:hypothetical protein